MPLHVASFGGGVVTIGSPDAQRTDELMLADSVEIGPRGQLVCASDQSDYLTINDTQAAPVAWKALYAMSDVVLGGVAYVLAVGLGRTPAIGTDVLFAAVFQRTGEASPLNPVSVTVIPNGTLIQPNPVVTIVQLPGMSKTQGGAVSGYAVLVCIGSREGTLPAQSPGLRVAVWTSGQALTFESLDQYDALGTGPKGEFVGGASAVGLNFRGIISYHNMVFGWGYDNSATVAAPGYRDGPNRVMFSNPGTPFKWGNDNIAAVGGNRAFTDSDALVLGDAGEIIRGAIKWNGKLYFGTNQQLHYVAGFGRDSLLTDGANPVAKSYNIVGPNAMVEGPDRLLYGVSDQGLWSYDGSVFAPHFKRLIDFAGHSLGYWDLIWTDPTASSTAFPGRTNQDLVWTAVDWDREQIVIGIPYCSAATGAGVGTDTVVIRYHTSTGGFTRQVFTGVIITAAAYLRRLGQQREVRLHGTSTVGKVTVQRYAYQATPTTAPILPATLPAVTFGPYTPFGPDGDGVTRRAYLTLAWESAALPLVFTIATRIDDAASDSFTLSVQAAAPGAPANGDVWVDTSQTDANLGNATAGALVIATGGYLVKTWSAATAAWRLIPGSGEQGTRGRIPLPLTRRVGARVTLTATCTAAAGRFEIEGVGINPGGGSVNA